MRTPPATASSAASTRWRPRCRSSPAGWTATRRSPSCGGRWRSAPTTSTTTLFLAEALLEHQPAKAAEAREILRRLLARQPVPELAVEQEKTLADARALLAKHPG